MILETNAISNAYVSVNLSFCLTLLIRFSYLSTVHFDLNGIVVLIYSSLNQFSFPILSWRELLLFDFCNIFFTKPLPLY